MLNKKKRVYTSRAWDYTEGRTKASKGQDDSTQAGGGGGAFVN